VDNLDYSSADVWVVSQNQILIVPQLTASAAGLKRIVNAKGRFKVRPEDAGASGRVVRPQFEATGE